MVGNNGFRALLASPRREMSARGSGTTIEHCNQRTDPIAVDSVVSFVIASFQFMIGADETWSLRVGGCGDRRTRKRRERPFARGGYTTGQMISGMHRVFCGCHMAVLMAVFRLIRRGLQRLLLIGGEERENLLVVGLVLFFCLGAPGRLRLGECGDLVLLVVRQFHRLDQLQGHFEAMNEFGEIRAAG